MVTRSFGDLSARIHGRLLLPGDNGYDGARAVWNAMVDKRPALIIQCADAEDVRTAIRFGREARLELGVRCGGHSITGQSVPDGGLMIDLTPMNAVRIDSDRHLGYVQGGALLRNLDVASHEHALATTAGNVSHTGVGGLTLGGGMGWLARQIGLACDNVVTFQLVTADGETLIASEAQDPDLYWGLRGGGGNFGVVTEFTFRLHPTTGRALSVDLFFAPEDGPQVIGGWRDLVREAPRQATATAWAGTAPDWPFLPTELRGTDLVSAGFVWVGDPEEGRKLIPAYRALGKTVAEAIDETSYLELQSSADEANRHGRRRYWKDLYFTEFSDEAVAAFVSRGGTADDGQFRAYGGFQAYGGAISEVGADETAFSHRDAQLEFVTAARWDDPAEDEVQITAARRFAAALEPFSSGAYVNGLSDEGVRGVRAAYRPETLARLTTLKVRYDPDNVFHLNHNISPSAEA